MTGRGLDIHISKGGISRVTPQRLRPCFNRLHLSYTCKHECQCKATVKVHGVFRLTAGTPHLHGEFNFTESMLETAGKSLRHSWQVGTYPTRNFATLGPL